MNAPLIWIVIPLALAVFLWFVQNQQRLVLILGVGICLALALLAWLTPLEQVIKVGTLTVEIPSTLVVFGRRFILHDGHRSLLIFLYVLGAFWFVAELAQCRNRFFAPLGLALIALTVAALSVDPFLYAALLIEVMALLSIPLLMPPGRSAGQGVLRYLIFQTLALPFILLAGWFAAGVEANPADSRLLLQTVSLLGLGFAIWLAVFPFYTWVPLLASEVRPLVAGFVLSLLPTLTLMLTLDFINSYAWLRDFPLLPQALRYGGLVMILTAGGWALFQKDLARLMGYAVILESGFSLLALSLGEESGHGIFMMLLQPRLLALGLMGLSMAVLSERGSLEIGSLKGALRSHPLASIGLLGAAFSLGGLPLLAGFPAKQLLLESLAAQERGAALLALGGLMGFLLSGFRVLGALVNVQEDAEPGGESLMQRALLAAGMGALLLTGLFPQRFLQMMTELLKAFG